MKENDQKVLKKLTLFFLSKPVHFNGQDYEKKGGLELIALRVTKKIQKNSFISDVSPDQV